MANSNSSAPIRRLMITGNDTPLSFLVLFCTNGEKLVEQLPKRHYLQLFCRRQKGSPMCEKVARARLDEGCLPWTRREASEEEEAEMLRIWGTQKHIAVSLGLKRISSFNMNDPLEGNTGWSWATKLGYYQITFNSMDQRHTGNSWSMVVRAGRTINIHRR